jgi:ABC-type multidrug transport system ATPase subunit
MGSETNGLDSRESAIRVREVGFSYGRHVALAGVSTTFAPGVNAVVGANGAGKTTLLRLLAGLLKPATGTIERGAASGSGSGPRVSYLPQNPPSTRLLTAQSYVAYFAALAGVARGDVDGRARAALREVGLEDVANRATSTLSGGMFRRVALAAALSCDPQVLLLDEPTAGLDPVQRVAVLDLVARLAAGDRVIVLATHLMEDVASIADHVTVLNGTRAVFSGTPQQLAGSARSVAGDRLGPSLEAALIELMGAGEEPGDP